MHNRKRTAEPKRKFVAKFAPAPVEANDAPMPTLGKRRERKRRRRLLIPIPAQA